MTIFDISILVLNNETMMLIYKKMLRYESIIIHILMFASASLYIPISVSIKKKAHLVSIIKHKPDRFILYQTIGLAVFKVSSLRMHLHAQFEVDRPVSSSEYPMESSRFSGHNFLLRKFP
ncbi:unnamed protein product [Caenorhabditis nigoni]